MACVKTTVKLWEIIYDTFLVLNAQSNHNTAEDLQQNRCVKYTPYVYKYIQIGRKKVMQSTHLKHKPNNKNHRNARNDICMILNNKLVAENWRIFIALPTSRNCHFCFSVHVLRV